MSQQYEKAAKLEKFAASQDMSGLYNDPGDGGYDFCRRGMEFLFPLNPGDPFPATAVLIGGFEDPELHLQITPVASGTASSTLFKERVPTEPPIKFRSHAQCTGAFSEGTPPVNVTVHVTANTQGGVEVQIVKQ